MTAPVTRAVVKALTADGADVRFVGGCVRDALLGRESADIDIGTPDPPERVMALLGRAGIETRTVPAQSSTAPSRLLPAATATRSPRSGATSGPTAGTQKSPSPTTGSKTRRAATSPSMP